VSEDGVSAFHLSEKANLWLKLMHEHVFSKMTGVTKLAVQLQAAKLVETIGKQDVPVSYKEEAQALKDRVWQAACLDNDTAFLRNLLYAGYFIAKGKPSLLTRWGRRC
jgi:hypothetical protein